jgi:hypothetical protein
MSKPPILNATAKLIVGLNLQRIDRRLVRYHIQRRHARIIREGQDNVLPSDVVAGRKISIPLSICSGSDEPAAYLPIRWVSGRSAVRWGSGRHSASRCYSSNHQHPARKIVSHSHAAGHMTLVGLEQEIDRRHVIRYESL